MTSHGTSIPRGDVAVIIVDHGSRRTESNQSLHQATLAFAERFDFEIVEPAHMELAKPDIATAFDRCIARGGRHVVVFPYFLSPGRHWNDDIPRLVAQAAAKHPDITWVVTEPFGLHEGMLEIMRERILAVCDD